MDDLLSKAGNYGMLTLYVHITTVGRCAALKFGRSAVAVGTLGRWNGWAIAIGRTFLASTLLLGAFARIPQLAFPADLVLPFELLLGTAIAVGLLVRYAAALVAIDLIGKHLLVGHFYPNLLPHSTGNTVAMLIASGLLVLLSWNTGKEGNALIDEKNAPRDQPLRRSSHCLRDGDIEVTVRLEGGHSRSLCEYRCIVTIHDQGTGIPKTAREAWYANGGRQ